MNWKLASSFNENLTILPTQRVPIGAVSCLELPAGMIDSENDGVAGTAAREMEEECGIKLRPSDLTDLTELGLSEAVESGTIPFAAVAPSPGGCDEFIRYMYTERIVTKASLDKMRERLMGLREEGEYITLRVVDQREMWKVSADNKAMWYVWKTRNYFSLYVKHSLTPVLSSSALFLVDQLRKDGKLPPCGGLVNSPNDPILRMRDGRVIPMLAFGLYKVPSGSEGLEIILKAIEAGYRHFDTASIYGNEFELGKAIKLSGRPREEFFICSKVWNDAQKNGMTAVRQSVEASLQTLGCGYLDVMYIHWPVPGHFVETYKVLQELRAEGLVRNIGISNFGIAEYEELISAKGITVPPAVNQIEISPLMYRPENIQYFQDRGLVMVASKALHRVSGVDEGPISSIAAKNHATAAQVMIRWGILKRLVVVAKTSSPARMAENRAAVAVSLAEEELKQLDSLTSAEDVLAREELELQRKNGI